MDPAFLQERRSNQYGSWNYNPNDGVAKKQGEFKRLVETKVVPKTNKAIGGYVSAIVAPAGCVAAPLACATAAAASAKKSIDDQMAKNGKVDLKEVAEDTVKGVIVTGDAAVGGEIAGPVGAAVAAAAGTKGTGGTDNEAIANGVGAGVGATTGNSPGGQVAGEVVGQATSTEVKKRLDEKN